MVYRLSDPNDAMEFWIKTFNSIYNKHAPFKTKRVKQKAKPKWLSAEQQKAIHLRDLYYSQKVKEHFVKHTQIKNNTNDCSEFL